MSDSPLGQSDVADQSLVIGQMRMDLIDLSYRMPEGDAELPRLWNEAYDALVALQKRMEGWADA